MKRAAGKGGGAGWGGGRVELGGTHGGIRSAASLQRRQARSPQGRSGQSEGESHLTSWFYT